MKEPSSRSTVSGCGGDMRSYIDSIDKQRIKQRVDLPRERKMREL